jgi:RNA polymerase sigma factor (sigma-70 family)
MHELPTATAARSALDISDTDLLQAWVRHQSQADFTEIVRRHLGLVQGIARRQLGPDLADDTAQLVFAILARKASSLTHLRSVSSWLHRVTLLQCRSTIRGQIRERRNQQAAMETVRLADARDPLSEALPHLDSAIGDLSASDRELILLRYSEGLTFTEAARRTGRNEAALRQQVSRAVEKLSVLLRRRGVSVPAAALTTGLGVTLAGNSTASAAGIIAAAALGTAGSLTGSSVAAVTLFTMTAKQSIIASAILTALLIAIPIVWHSGQGAGKSLRKNAGDRNTNISRAERNPLRERQVEEDVMVAFARLLSASSKETDIWKVISRLPMAGIPAALQRLGEARASTSIRSPEADRLNEIECAIYFKWAESDPVAALADVSAIPEPTDAYAKAKRHDLAKSILAAWMRVDPNAAYRAVKDRKDFGYVGRDMLVQTWTEENVFENLKLFPDKHEDLLGWYCVAAAQNEVQRNAMLKALKEQPEMQDRDWAYVLVFRSWAQTDFPSAMAEAANHDHPGLVQQVLEDGLSAQPAATMRWAVSRNIAPVGRSWLEGYRNWLTFDPVDARKWLGEQAPAWKSAGHFATVADFQAAQLERTEKIDMETAKPIWVTLMKEWKNKDPEAAAKWLDTAMAEAVRGILKEQGTDGHE